MCTDGYHRRCPWARAAEIFESLHARVSEQLQKILVWLMCRSLRSTAFMFLEEPSEFTFHAESKTRGFMLHCLYEAQAVWAVWRVVISDLKNVRACKSKDRWRGLEPSSGGAGSTATGGLVGQPLSRDQLSTAQPHPWLNAAADLGVDLLDEKGFKPVRLFTATRKTLKAGRTKNTKRADLGV